jgi:cytochrome P450
MEMRIILGRVLERTQLTAVDDRLAKAQFRAITLSPKGGVRVCQSRNPQPAVVPAPEREPVA